MTNKKLGSLDELEIELRQDAEYRKAERRLRPYTDLVVQINTRRNDLCLTQKDLAERAKTHQSRISRIETGEHDIRLSTLIDIAEALNSEVFIQLIPISEPNDVDIGADYVTLFTEPIQVQEANSSIECDIDVEYKIFT